MLSGFQAELVGYYVSDVGFCCTDRRCVASLMADGEPHACTAMIRYTADEEACELGRDIECENCGDVIAECDLADDDDDDA